MVAPLLIVSTNTGCKHRTCCNIVAYEVSTLTYQIRGCTVIWPSDLLCLYGVRLASRSSTYIIRDCRQVLRFSNNALRAYCSSKDLVEFQTIRISQDGKNMNDVHSTLCAIHKWHVVNHDAPKENHRHHSTCPLCWPWPISIKSLLQERVHVFGGHGCHSHPTWRWFHLKDA